MRLGRTMPLEPMADSLSNPVPGDPITVRTYCATDASVCRALYVDGLITGKLPENDTSLDIDDVVEAYLNRPESHFWVAENQAGKVVGMVGVLAIDAGVGEIRRLRVDPLHRRRGIGRQLMEAAVGFCRDRGYVKIMLDTFIDREPAINLFKKFNFRHSRTRKVGEKELLDFYLDLYQRDER